MKKLYIPLLLVLAALFLGGCFEHGEIKSADATVKMLKVSIQRNWGSERELLTLSPAFNPKITEYSVNVNGNLANVEIKGNVNPKAKVNNSGGSGEFIIYRGDINEGENRIPIGIIAENGTQKTYYLTVNRTNIRNLSFIQMSGWADKAVLSKENNYAIGTDVMEFDTIDTIYYNFSYKLSGGDVNNGMSIKVYIDDVIKQTYNIPNIEGEAQIEQFKNFNELLMNASNLVSGTHTLKIVLDADNSIAESDENDNVFTKTFTVNEMANTSPVDLTALSGFKNVELKWFAPSGLGDYQLKYKIFRSTDGTAFNFLVDIFTNMTSYIDFTATDAITYYYKVQTVLSGQKTNWVDFPAGESQVVTANPISTPPAPTGLIAAGNLGGIDLNWVEPNISNNYSRYYKIYRSTDGTTFNYISPGNDYTTGGTAFRDSSITNGTTYHYKVQTVIYDYIQNKYVSGEYSDVVSTITMDIKAPTGLTAVAGSGYGKADLSWTAPTGLDGYSIFYKIYRSTDGVNYNAIDSNSYNSSTTSFTDISLESGITYYYKVQTVIYGQATNWNYTHGSLSTEASVTPNAIPASTSVSAISGYKSVELTWIAPVIPAGYSVYYKIYRSTDGSSYNSIDSNTYNTQYTAFSDKSLSSITYYYKVQTVIYGQGTNWNYVFGSMSTAASATPSSTPPAPTELIATGNIGSIDLSWTAPESLGDYSKYYKVYRSTDNTTFTYLSPGSDYTTASTAYRDSTVTTGTTYYYKVQTVIYDYNQSKYVAGDTSSSASTISMTIAAPTDLMASAGTGYGKAELTWTAPTGLEGYTIYYKIYRSTNGTTYNSIDTNTYNTSDTWFTDMSLASGTMYYYKVQTVIYGQGTNWNYTYGAMSTAASVTPNAIPEPTGLTAAGGYKNVELTWTAPDYSGTDSVYYKIYRSTNGTTFSAISTNTYDAQYTNYNDMSLTAGTTYYYKVQTVIYGQGTNWNYVKGALSDTASAIPSSTPPAPTEMLAEGDYGGINLSWTAPGGLSSYSKYYKVYRSTNGTTFTYVSPGNDYTTGSTTFKDSSITGGTTYYYKVLTVIYDYVKSQYVAGTVYSTIVNAASIKPPAPTDVSVTAGTGYGVLNVNWNAPAGLDNFSIYYKIYRSSDGASYSPISGSTYDTTTNSFADNMLPEGTTFYYKVQTILYGQTTNWNFISGDMSIASSGSPNLVPAPTEVAASGGYGNIGLSWTAPTISASYSKYYKVYRSTDGILYEAVTTNTYDTNLTSYKDTSVTNGITYYYKVKTVIYGAGTNYNYILGAFSTAANATPQLPPAATEFVVSGGYSSIGLSWTAPVGLSGYEVYYKVYRSTNGTSFTYLSIGSDYTVNNTSYIDTSVTNGTTYYYKVKTVIRSSSTNWAYLDGDSTAAATGVSNLAPAVTDFTAVNGYGGIGLSWTAPTGMSGYNVYYKVYRSTDDVIYTYLNIGSDYSTNNTNYIDNSVSNGITYHYKVKTVINSNLTNYTYKDGSITDHAMASSSLAPAATTLTAASGYKSVILNWIAPSTLGGYEIYYKIYRSTDGVTFSYISGTNEYTTNTTSFTDGSLTNGTTYYYKVRTVARGSTNGYAYANGEYTTASSAVPNIPPGPTGLGATPGSGYVYLSWASYPVTNGYVNSYKVYRSTDNATFTEVSNYGSSNYSYDYPPSGTYYYKVSAYVYDYAAGYYETQKSASVTAVVP